ncbi:MAG: cytochrome c family protein [Ancalomicrobiaceae bacterium]|nr:cytochrome c family protein [Ancalomicrobiaceae bacterium]
MKVASFVVAAAAVVVSTAPGLAGDPVAGKTVFGKCALCHTIDPAKKNIGPTLFGVVGRHSASVEGYPYSPAMKSANKTWDEATLDVYLTKPQALVPGTKMTFAGLPNAEDRANVIAYLATLK